MVNLDSQIQLTIQKYDEEQNGKDKDKEKEKEKDKEKEKEKEKDKDKERKYTPRQNRKEPIRESSERRQVTKLIH